MTPPIIPAALPFSATVASPWPFSVTAAIVHDPTDDVEVDQSVDIFAVPEEIEIKLVVEERFSEVAHCSISEDPVDKGEWQLIENLFQGWAVDNDATVAALRKRRNRSTMLGS